MNAWRRNLRLGGLVLLALLSSASARAQLTFQFNYLDSGTGFNDPTLGAIRRGAFESAAGMLGGYVQTVAPVTVTLSVSSFNFGNGFLASMDSPPASTTPGILPTIAQQKILGGPDANGASADGTVNWNFFHNWDYDDSVAANAYDFKSTVMHELMHALGFISQIDGFGRGYTISPVGTPDVYTVFDSFLTDASGNPLLNGNTFNIPEVGDLTGNPGVFFAGPNAMAAYGGLVPLYSPNPFELASSLHHLNDASFSNPNLLMEAALFTGPSSRDLSAVELGILRDLGYAIVPEPASLTLLGAGLACLALRRRRARAASPCP